MKFDSVAVAAAVFLCIGSAAPMARPEAAEDSPETSPELLPGSSSGTLSGASLIDSDDLAVIRKMKDNNTFRDNFFNELTKRGINVCFDIFQEPDSKENLNVTYVVRPNLPPGSTGPQEESDEASTQSASIGGADASPSSPRRRHRRATQDRRSYDHQNWFARSSCVNDKEGLCRRSIRWINMSVGYATCNAANCNKQEFCAKDRDVSFMNRDKDWCTRCNCPSPVRHCRENRAGCKFEDIASWRMNKPPGTTYSEVKSYRSPVASFPGYFPRTYYYQCRCWL